MRDYIDGNQLLISAFKQRFGVQWDFELSAFRSNLSLIPLPFALAEQVRVWEHPPFTYTDEQGRLKTYRGLPPKYCYFIPDSNYRGDKPFPEDPLDPSSVSIVDGLGMNFGCPLRLHEAMKVFAELSESDRVEPRSGLKASKKHVATVEELFAAGIWEGAPVISRPKSDTRKSYDWDITFGDLTFRLECKYRPAFWRKNSEPFDIMPGALLRKASEQLPHTGGTASLNVVIVIAACSLDDSIRIRCAQELNAHPSIDALVFLDIVGEANVFSKSGEKARIVGGRIRQFAADDFGGFSPFAYFREQATLRKHARASEPQPLRLSRPRKVAEYAVQSLAPRSSRLEPPPPQFPYRCSIEHLADGEPVLTFIPPFNFILYGSIASLLDSQR